MRENFRGCPYPRRFWRQALLAGAGLTALMLAGCAARLALPPTGIPPHFPDFVFPEVPPDLQGSTVVLQHDLAWRWLQTGDTRNAEKVFTEVLRLSPTFYPSEAGLGLVRLAGQDYTGALAHFDRALQRSAVYVPALLARAETLLAVKRDADALGSFQAALAVDGSLDVAKRWVEVLQFRLLQANLSSARDAAEAGRSAEAIAAYQQAIGASPQSAFLYRELGAVERKNGNVDAALDHYQRATELEPSDPSAWRGIGEILEGRDDYPAAVEAYGRSIALEPSAAIQERITRLRALLALARMPAEYRQIPESTALTRGELAALVGVRFEKLLDGIGPGAAVVVTDTRQHWAASWIFAVTRAGVMDAYPNHTFQPASIVRRSDLAQVVSQLLNLIARRNPAVASSWKKASPTIADVGPGNLNYGALSLAVQSGIMPLLDGGTFQASRSVSGAEGVAAIERLERLLP
jgi:tetratricopeptide (TPR) repeat protein